MTVDQAGRIGGLTTLKKHGVRHFQAAGLKGGATTRERYGSAHFAELGKRGGRKPRFPDASPSVHAPPIPPK